MRTRKRFHLTTLPGILLPVTLLLSAMRLDGCAGGLAQGFPVRVFVTNACGVAAIQSAMFTICPADYNCDGALNSSDFFDFVTGFFEGAPRADFNNSGLIDSQDFFDFLAAFFAGC